MKVYKDKEGRMYKMAHGIDKVYLTDKEVAWQETLARTNKATTGKARMLDPFVGYIARVDK